MTLLILGIGQSLRHDDGVGPAAIKLFQENFPQDANNPLLRIEISELPGLNLLNLLQNYEAAVLVDAVSSGVMPGTIHLLTEKDLSSFSPGAGSAHGWGVAETLALGRKLNLYNLPKDLFLLGVEGQDFSPGEGLSQIVRDQLPIVCNTINSLIHEYFLQSGERQ